MKILTPLGIITVLREDTEVAEAIAVAEAEVKAVKEVEVEVKAAEEAEDTEAEAEASSRKVIDQELNTTETEATEAEEM